MSRPVVTADVIAELRTRVAGHNERHPAARTRLNDLKKIFSRRGMGAVEGHLTKLAKASGDFDEGKHRRDENGRFAPKGGGSGRQGWQERLYSDVATPETHRRLRDESRGYESATTAVVPETRYTELGQWAGGAAGIAAGGWSGASAMRNPDGGFIRRWARRKSADLAGGLAGGTVKTVTRLAGAASHGLTGVPGPNAVDAVAMRAGNAAQRGVSRLVSGVGSAINRATTWPARKAAEAEIASMPPPRNALERTRRAYRAAYAGTRYGLLWPGIPFAMAGYYGMRDYVGPAADATFPRRVEKALTGPADPRSREVLQKAIAGAAWRGAKKKVARLFGRTPSQKAAATRGANAAAETARSAKYERIGRLAARTRMRQAGAYGLGGLGLTALGGAALGGGAGAAAGYGGVMANRRYYRDENGRFTSKERDVGDRGPKAEGLSAHERGVIAGLAGAGVVGGAIAGAQFIRGRNAAVARRILEGVPGTRVIRPDTTGEVSVSVPASFMASRGPDTKRPDLKLGTQATARRSGAEPTISAEQTLTDGSKATTTRSPFTAYPPKPGTPDYQALPADERLKLLRDRARERAMVNLERAKGPALEAATRRSKATTDALKAAWNSSDPTDWANLQVDLQLRDRLRGLAGAKAGFYEKGQKPEDWKRLKSALTSKVLVGKDGKVAKPDALSDLMNGNYDGFPLTDRQKTIIDKIRSEASDAKAAYKARIDALAQANQAIRKEAVDLKTAHALKQSDLTRRQQRLEEVEQIVKDGGESPIKNLPKYRDDIAKLEAEVADLNTSAEAAMKRVAEAADALKPAKAPPIENPWARTTFLTSRPVDDKELNALISAVSTNELKGLTDEIAQAASRSVADLDRAANAAQAVYQRALRGVRESDNVPVGFQRARDLMNRLGPPLRSFGQDAARLGREVKDAVAARLPSIETLKTKAQDAGTGVMSGARWANRNAKELLVAGATGTAIATTLGLADQADDGEVNFRFDRVKDIPAHLVAAETRPRPVNFIRNPGLDSEVRLSLIAAPNLSGERIVVSGVRIVKDKDGKQVVQDIPAGSRVKDVVADTNEMARNRRQAQQQKPGQGGAKPRVEGSQEQHEAWAKALGVANAKGYVVRADELGDDAFSYRKQDSSGDAEVQQPGLQVRDALLKEVSDKVRAGGKFNTGAWYETAARVFEADETNLLNPNFIHQVLAGTDKQAGLLLPGVRESYGTGTEKAKFAGALRNSLTGLAPPRDDAQMQAVRRIVGFYQHIVPAQGMRLTSDEATRLIGEIESKRAASPAPAPKPAPVAGPPPAATVRTSPQGATTVESFDDEEARKGAIVDGVGKLTRPVSDGGYGVKVLSMAGRARVEQMFDAAVRAVEQDLASKRTPERSAEDWWAEVQAEAERRTMGRIRPAKRKEASWSAGDLRKASHALLRKAAEEGIPGRRREFDEQKIRRNPRGDDRGGEFAPKAGGSGPARPRAERQAPPAPPERSFFEPVRMGGMLGGALGGAAAFEVASRYLPKPLRTAGTVARLASRLGGAIGPRTARFAARAAGKTAAIGIRGPAVLAGAIAGGLGGQMGGEEVGAATYRMRGKEAPPGWDPPEREAGEELTRAGAGIGTQAVVSAAAKTAMRGTIYGAIASLGVEEVAARAYAAAEKRYGPEVAARVARGAMPTPTYQ